MSRDQSLMMIAAIALFAVVAFIVIFASMSAGEELAEGDVVEDVADDIDEGVDINVEADLGDEVDPTATPIIPSVTPLAGAATVVTPQQFASNGTPITVAGASNSAPAAAPAAGAGGAAGIDAQAPDSASVAVVQASTATNCTPRTDLPVYVVQQGDILSSIAESVGATVDELIAYNCLINEDNILVDQPLYVPNLPADSVVVVTPTAATEIIVVTETPAAPDTVIIVQDAAEGVAAPGCNAGWFFIFNEAQTDPACPDNVTTVQAVGQNFENGRIYVYDSPPITPDTRGIGFVIYNDGTWEAYLDNWDGSMPMDDSALIPPRGMFQPTGAIGKIWRENPTLQTNLGWAIEPPESFVGRTQLPAVTSNYFYIDHGVEGYVLRLTTSEDALNTWELIGIYS